VWGRRRTDELRDRLAAAGTGGPVPLDDPARVVQGDRVTHLRYDVRRRPA
jgi:hypothetical protein